MNVIKKSGARPVVFGLLSLFVVAHFAHHLLGAILIPLLPMIRNDLDLDYTQAGFVVSAFNLAYGFSQLPAGWLTDHVESRLMVTISIAGVAVVGLLVGLSQGYVMLIALLIIMGILGGGYHAAASIAITSAVKPGKWGQALGLHMIGGAASFFFPPLVAAAIAGFWGWRGSFVALSIPMIIFGVAFYMLLKRKLTQTGGEQALGKSIKTASTSVPLRRLAALIFLASFSQAVMASIRSFVPLFMVDHFGVGVAVAAASMSLMYVAGFWASPMGGYLSDRWGRIPLVVATSVIICVLIYLLNVAAYPLWFDVLLVALGMASYVYSPVLQAYIIENTPEGRRSMVLSFYFFGSSEVGGVLTPLMGYGIDHWGFNPTFGLAAGVVLAATLVCTLFLMKRD